jgi:hypothetical protein
MFFKRELIYHMTTSAARMGPGGIPGDRNVNEGCESLTSPQKAGVPGAKRKQQCRTLYPPRAHHTGGAKLTFLENNDGAP